MVMERRRFPRTPVIINVDIHILGGPVFKGCSRDISHGGVSVDLYGGEPPAIHAKARIEFIIWSGTENIQRRLEGRIVRSSSAAAALQFIDEPGRTKIIIDEILHYRQFERRTKPRPRHDAE